VAEGVGTQKKKKKKDRKHGHIHRFPILSTTQWRKKVQARRATLCREGHPRGLSSAWPRGPSQREHPPHSDFKDEALLQEEPFSFEAEEWGSRWIGNSPADHATMPTALRAWRPRPWRNWASLPCPLFAAPYLPIPVAPCFAVFILTLLCHWDKSMYPTGASVADHQPIGKLNS
jgi:hypothetical protein